MERKIGWIVPSHPPRKLYLENLIKSFEKYSNNVDLIIIWTHKKDNHIIENQTIKNLYLEEYFSVTDIEIFESSKSIINVKKIFGLMMEYRNYHGLVCTDDELEFVRDFSDLDIWDKFNEPRNFAAIDVTNYKSKNFLLRKILIECNKIIADDLNRMRIKELTDEYSAYGWFADIPYYDCQRIPYFLEVIGIKNLSDLQKLNFFTFDHILYQFSCLLSTSCRYEIMDWENAERFNAYSWFECFHVNAKGREYAWSYQQRYNPSWTTSKNLLEIFDNAFCIFHIDRQSISASKYAKLRNMIQRELPTVAKFLANIKKTLLHWV